jgi:hypothetical protein
MYRTRNFIQTRFVIFLFHFLFCGLLNAQWAGSSSPAGSSKVNTSVGQSKTTDGITKVYFGLGLGGYSSSLTKATMYQLPNWVQQTDGKTTGGNYILGFLGKTRTTNLTAGLEIGLGSHSKDIDYAGNTGSIRSIHIGVGVPIRYTFVRSSDAEAYFQGVFGYGFVDVYDDQYNSYLNDGQSIFYGGGAIGARASIFFAELGYNSTGYLRFGMAF